MKHRARFVVALLSAAVLTACGGDDEVAEEVIEEPVGGMEGMGGMPGMQGMGGMHMPDGMMEQMQAHMAAMMAVGADSTAALMPQHRQMAANMLAQMNREMREMNMTADEGWTATVDSLRQDLTRMPEMSAEELQAFMPAHQARMARLMEMHRAMMDDMPM